MLEAVSEVHSKFVGDLEWITEFVLVVPFSSFPGVTFRCSAEEFAAAFGTHRDEWCRGRENFSLLEKHDKVFNGAKILKFDGCFEALSIVY